MISFTGSLRAGRRIMELASDRVKRLVLELGGKHADLDRGIPDGIADAFRNSGQPAGA